MKRIAAILLSSFIPLTSMPTLAQVSPEARGHTEWIAESLLEMKNIKAGMTRAELLRVFTFEGGASTRLRRTYVYRECPYIKVNVEFEPAGQPTPDFDGRLLPGDSDEDLIIQISRPYLDWIVAD